MSTRVLMIDDALPLHRLVAAQLRAADVELHSAVDAAAGLAAAEHLRPAVILLDVDLPDLDGLSVCRHLKANGATADIPVIFLTAEGGAGRPAALASGAADYVTKPFKAEDLSARVVATIRDRSAAERATGVDPVTGLWTRARLDRHLLGRPTPPGRPTACIVADVDGLRLINARHGSAAGDEVLRAMAGVVRQYETGWTACWSEGGTFGLVLSDTDRGTARHRAEGLRGAIAGPATCGFGVADTIVAGDAHLVGRAEGALAAAKRNGPGRISVARPPRRQWSAAA